MKNGLLYTCKQATMLVSKLEEGKLGIVAKMRLQMHLAMCRFCRLFMQQSKLIAKHGNTMPETEKPLPANRKERIQQQISDIQK